MNEDKVEKLIEVIDKTDLLGAAYDCLSDKSQNDFKKKVSEIILSKEINE